MSTAALDTDSQRPLETARALVPAPVLTVTSDRGVITAGATALSYGVASGKQSGLKSISK